MFLAICSPNPISHGLQKYLSPFPVSRSASLTLGSSWTFESLPTMIWALGVTVWSCLQVHLGSLAVPADHSCFAPPPLYRLPSCYHCLLEGPVCLLHPSTFVCDWEGIFHPFPNFILLCCQVVPSLKSLFFEVVRREKPSALSSFLLQYVPEEIFYCCISGLLKDGAYMALG